MSTKEGFESLTSSQLQVQRIFERIQEEERFKISRTLHDELGQNLALLKFKISCETQLESQSEIMGLIDETISRLRQIAFEIRPLILDDLGLPIALEKKLNHFQASTGIECRLEMDTDLHVHPPLDIGIYRLVQEGFNNILRHSAARNVLIRLRKIDSNLHLEIRDDGCGFDDSRISTQEKFGISSMKERVFLLGGDIRINSWPGQGTSVQAVIPMAGAIHS